MCKCKDCDDPTRENEDETGLDRHKKASKDVIFSAIDEFEEKHDMKIQKAHQLSAFIADKILEGKG